MDLRQRIEALLSALCKGLYEREKPVRLALLTAVAGESIFLLGPPGVGKSLIARRLKYAFRDGTSFEYLMSKFSTPDEIFGPVSIKKLKEEDKYERLTERYLPNANIVFLDEIWKAGPSIQNALLTILNEKIYRNGDQDIEVDIKGIITASNELPPKSQNLAPIWDRFLVRLEMGNIKEYKNFLSMIIDTKDVYDDDIKEALKISNAEFEAWSESINAIEIPSEVLNTLQVVKFKVEEYNSKPNNASNQIHIFDRRWKKVVRLLRTSAFLNGRDKVDLMDCFLMVDCLWNSPSQLETLQEIVSETVRKHGYSMSVNLNMLKKEITEFEEEVSQEVKVPYTVTKEQLLPVQEDYYEVNVADGKFKGELITMKAFKQLDIDEPQVVNFYDKEQNLVNRIKTRKSSEFAIEVEFSSERTVYNLTTKKMEETQIVYKKPHKLVEQFWDERHEKLSKYIREQLQRLKTDAPEELKDLENNLFVPSERSEIVKANMKEVADALTQLKIRLEKVKYAYASLT